MAGGGGKSGAGRAALGLRTGRGGDLIAALDIGCSKIGCLIAKVDGPTPDDLRLVGGGHQSSRGFEAGSITDMDALERAIRMTVEDAEKQAGEAISDVIVGISAPQVKSRLIRGAAEIGGREVTPRDVRRVQADGMAHFWETAEEGVDVLASTPIAYAIEGSDGVRDPVGMYTGELGVILNVVTAPSGVVRNLRQAVLRAHLNVAAIVPAATASALGTLVEDERENGAICIDIGAGLTAISMFINGVPAGFARVAVGGQHITRDIAQAFGTTLAAAERVKTVHGRASVDVASALEMIECPRLGDDGRLKSATISRRELANVVGPRVEEIFEFVLKRLDASPLKPVLPRRIVLTGGSSDMPGVREIAQRVLGRPVRIARPVSAEKLGETLATPAFSTAAGLLLFALAGLPDAGRGGAAAGANGAREGKTLVSRAVGWLKENF